MNRGLAILVIVLVVLAAGFVFANREAVAPSREGEEATTTVQAKRTFAWRFETTESSDGVLSPRTRVALITGGDVYDMGHYAGSCAEIAQENLLEGEVSGILCWWAGHGDEIGVFRDGTGYSVMLGSQEEGTAEENGFRGGFTELVAIE